MNKITSTLACALFLSFVGYAQQKAKIPDNFLKAMQGDWKGKLTYTDYQDDSTQVTMDVWLKSDVVNKKLIKQFYYKEPDGNTKQKSKSQDTTYTTNGGENLIESGYKLPFRVVQFSTSKSTNSSSTTVDGVKVKKSAAATHEQMVVMETADDDNEKKSTIRTTITVDANNMTIKKEVKYEGTSKFFVRHTFYYSKS